MAHYKGKTAIVTGGGSGIGRAVCVRLGQLGAGVVVSDIDVEGAQETAAIIAGAGGQAQALYLDVTREADVRRLINETADEKGCLDFIFNNAGIGIIGDERDKTLAHWEKIFNINLYGVVYGTLAAYRVMVKQGHGHIVNTASLAGLIPAPMEGAYGASKHAVVGLSTSLRAEGAALGVKVSVVCPGFINTPIFDTSPVLNADRDTLMEKIPESVLYDVSKAARDILRGVERNHARIVFPFHARFLWYLYRLHPGIADWLGGFQAKKFREHRK